MRSFNICPNPYERDRFVFNNNKVDIESGLSILVGCNGIGKTSLLCNIKEELNKLKIKYISYSNVEDGGAQSISKSVFYDGNFNFAMNVASSSEGEGIVCNIERLARRIGTYVRKNPNQDEYWVFLYAIDSGLSIDNIIDIKKYLFETIIDDITSHNKKVYILVSANSYELCCNEKCIDVYNLKYINFNSYEEYKDFILKSKDIKNSRYN